MKPQKQKRAANLAAPFSEGDCQKNERKDMPLNYSPSRLEVLPVSKTPSRRQAGFARIGIFDSGEPTLVCSQLRTGLFWLSRWVRVETNLRTNFEVDR